MVRQWVLLCRPKHWVKNLFVLAPLVFALAFFSAGPILRALVACAAFCLASSAVYIVNDLADREQDRLHPTKKHRPLASGAVPARQALALAGVLLAAGTALALALGPLPLAILLAYFALNVAYSLALKNQIFVDVMVIAAGFLLRVAAGAAAIAVPLSQWMLLTTFFISLFLGFGKRRMELSFTRGPARQRPVLRQYSRELLNALMMVSASLAIIAYALWIVSSPGTTAIGPAWFILTVPPVVFGVFRFMHLAYANSSGGDAAEVLLADRPLLTAIGLWVLAVLALLVAARLMGARS